MSSDESGVRRLARPKSVMQGRSNSSMSTFNGLRSRCSDVYALGAMLYHLTTGRPPFVAQTPTETLRQMLEAEPVSPRLLTPGLPRDLETIALKCLEKDPARRYPTAQALADELSRFVNDEAIQARPVNAAEKLWRWCRRRPALAGAVGAAVVLLLAVVIGSPLAALRISAARQAEARERDRAEGRLYAAQMKLTHAAIKAGKIGGALKLLESQRPAPVSRAEHGTKYEEGIVGETIYVKIC